MPSIVINGGDNYFPKPRIVKKDELRATKEKFKQTAKKGFGGKKRRRNLDHHPSLWSDHRNSSDLGNSPGVVGLLNSDDDMVELGTTSIEDKAR